MAVPLGLRLEAVDFDQRAVDVERDAPGALAAALGPDASPGHLEHRTERLDVIPAQFRVLVTIRPKYVCRACAGAQHAQASAPEWLAPRGLPTESLVAHCMVAIFRDHLSFYRQPDTCQATPTFTSQGDTRSYEGCRATVAAPGRALATQSQSARPGAAGRFAVRGRSAPESFLEVAQAIAAALDVEDVRAVQQAIENGGGQHLVPGQKLGPVADTLAGGDE